ncbi:MAG: GrpB family protein [Devosia sp.]
MGEEAAEPLGLAKGKVLLAEADGRWAELFAMEERRLRVAIGSMVLGIEHFGGTAIPRIRAKPILDIMVGLERFEHGAGLVEPLERLGYDYVGIEMAPNDHLFGKGVARTHLLHAVEHNGHHWRRNLRFRDRLRLDPALAAAYEHLKIKLAERFTGSRVDCTAAKKAFIDRIADVEF